MNDNTFDYIIIGGGTAGCLLANRLSADASKRVLLIEAGKKDDYHWIHIPVGYLYCIGNPRTDWLYKTEPAQGLGGRVLRYPRGKALGGCSSINGMIYMRGQSRDYEHWADFTGEDAWRWQQVLPDFMRHEDHYKLDASAPDAAFAALHGHKSQPGAGGEWRVEKQRLQWDILDDFAQAAQQAGIAATEDFNGGNNEGVAYFEVNQRKGWRWNTAKAFLRPTCYGRPNFEMWTRAQVSQLLLEPQADGQPRCVGVRVWNGSQSIEAHLAADAPVCTLLSGGIDSTIIIASIARAANPRLMTFAAGSEDDAARPGSDLFMARRVAHMLGSDHHEVVTFLALGAITGGEVKVRDSLPHHFDLMTRAFAKLGVTVEHEGTTARVRARQPLQIEAPFTPNLLPKIEAAPWPYFPVDLLPCMIALSVRAKGAIQFWNKVYEGGFTWMPELAKFGAHIVVSDPHRVILFGDRPLRPATVDAPYIIRAAVGLYMVAASIPGRSIVKNADTIRRAHPHFVENLRSLGADVEWRE